MPSIVITVHAPDHESMVNLLKQETARLERLLAEVQPENVKWTMTPDLSLSANVVLS